MKQLPLAFQSGDTLLAELDPEHYITQKGQVVLKLTAHNRWVKPVLPIAPTDSLSLGDAEFMELTAPWRALQEYQKTGVIKHLQGQHDQSTHAGRKSYKSIDDLVKDGLDLQAAIDELGESNVENGNVAMRVLLERMGKGGKPETVASIDDLDGEPIYRGTLEENVDNFVNGEYDRIGLGHAGDGYYFSNQLTTANDYATNGSVITAGWKKDAKVMRFTNPETSAELYEIATSEAGKKWMDKLNINTMASEAEQAVFDNFAEYTMDAYVSDLILQGYDGMEIAQGGNQSYTIVFNREALQVVSE